MAEIKRNEELASGEHVYSFRKGILKLLKFRKNILFKGTQMEIWSCLGIDDDKMNVRFEKVDNFTEEDYNNNQD